MYNPVLKGTRIKKTCESRFFLFHTTGSVEFIEIIKPQYYKANSNDQPEGGIFCAGKIGEKAVGTIANKAQAYY